MIELLSFSIKLVMILGWLSLFVVQPEPQEPAPKTVDGFIPVNRRMMTPPRAGGR